MRCADLLCTPRQRRWEHVTLQTQEGFLPSDGSRIDPHATLLVVQPVTRTGQRDRRGVRVCAVVRPRLS